MNDPPGGAPPGGGGPNKPPDPSDPQSAARTVIDQPPLEDGARAAELPDPNAWESADEPPAAPTIAGMPIREPAAFAPTELVAAQPPAGTEARETHGPSPAQGYPAP